MPKPKLPVIEIAPRGASKGDVLPIPEDFTEIAPETPKTTEAMARSRALLADEAAHLESIGMTWEELQHYQDILSDRINIVPQGKSNMKP